MGDKQDALFKIRTGQLGKKVTLITPPAAQIRAYPSAFFEKNGHQKPKAILPKNSLTVQQLQASLTDGFALSRAKVEHATLFLYHFGRNLKGKLTEKWTSFGVEIGNVGAEISPWDLLEVVFSDRDPPAAVAYTGAVTSEVGLFGFILFLYRALSVRDRGTPQYRTSIHAKLAQLLAAPPFCVGKADFSSAGTAYATWASDPAYLAMIAAVDMFLYQFPSNEYFIKFQLIVCSIGSMSCKIQ